MTHVQLINCGCMFSTLCMKHKDMIAYDLYILQAEPLHRSELVGLEPSVPRHPPSRSHMLERSFHIEALLQVSYTCKADPCSLCLPGAPLFVEIHETNPHDSKFARQTCIFYTQGGRPFISHVSRPFLSLLPLRF